MHTLVEKPDKGLFMGACNRQACQKPGANWYNHSTRAYYCAECAGLINYPGGRADAMRLYGHLCCTEGEHKPVPASTTNWDYVNSPIGPITVPGFDKVRAMTDAELIEYMNTQAFVDPAGITVCQNERPNICHYYHQGKGWIWATQAERKAYTGSVY